MVEYLTAYKVEKENDKNYANWREEEGDNNQRLIHKTTNE